MHLKCIFHKQIQFNISLYGFAIEIFVKRKNYLNKIFPPNHWQLIT